MPILGTIASSYLQSTTAYNSIATATVTSGVTSITFSSIPSTYKHLVMTWFARTTENINAQGTQTIFNNDTGSNYAFAGQYASDTAEGAYIYANRTEIEGPDVLGNNATGQQAAFTMLEILNYANTNMTKHIRGYNGRSDGPSVLFDVRHIDGMWFSTSAITSIKVTVKGTGNFSTNSVFALYGIG